MVLPDESPAGAPAWPPPHTSPPLPPPREYGAPGSSPSRAPYVVGAVAVVGVVVVALLVVLLGSDEEAGGRARDKEPVATDSAPASETPAAAYTCWDAKPAASLDECSAPTGEPGLRWAFPAMAQAKCGQASTQGGDGVVTRVLCLHRFADGTRAQLGFFEWASVDQGVAFYDAQGLTRVDAGELHGWSGVTGKTAKAATLYAAAPYSVTVTYPAAVMLSPEDQAALAPRPAAELRGVPAQ